MGGVVLTEGATQVYVVVASSIVMGFIFGFSFGFIDVEDESRRDRRQAPQSRPSALIRFLHSEVACRTTHPSK